MASAARAIARERQLSRSAAEAPSTRTSRVTAVGSVDAIQSVVRSARKSGSGLVPVSSGGSGGTAADAARRGLMIVDLSSMRALVHADRRDKIAHIEPGVTFGAIDGLLAPHGLRAFRPLMPRAGKSVLASHLDREPILHPNDHWDVADPFGGTMIVFGDGRAAPTGGAAIPGQLEDQLARGNRHMLQVGPANLDLLRIAQGAQGTLGIMAWGAIYCQALPSIERGWFCEAHEAEALVDLARTLLHRRLGDVLFLADRMQLAMLLARDPAGVERIAPTLPPWSLFVSLTAGRHAPEQKMVWQVADLERYAAASACRLAESIAKVSASTLLHDLRNPERGSDARKGQQRLFFLSQLDRAPNFRAIVETALAEAGLNHLPLACHLQPMAQGVSCHVGFTVVGDPAMPGQAAAVTAAIAVAATRCAEAGGFFSRPYDPWMDIAFRQGASSASLAALAKSTFDPDGIMNPGRFPYGGAAA